MQNLIIYFCSFCSSLIFLLRGFCSLELFLTNIYAYLGIAFYISISNKNLFNAILSIICTIFLTIEPSTSSLLGFGCLYSSLIRKDFTLVFVLFWIADLLNLTPTTYLGICSLFSVSFIVSLYLRRTNIYQHTIILSCLVITITTIVNVVSKPTMHIEKYTKSIYSPSEVFKRITNLNYIEKESLKENDNIIRSKSFFTTIDDSHPGICIFDVDYNGDNSLVDKKIWQQPTPWHNNLFFGDQYYIEAILKDGGLWSNKGISLKEGDGVVKLSYPKSIKESSPLIVNHNDCLYLHDSDYTSSYLANYQKNFIQEITNSGIRPILVRLLNLLLLICCVFSILEYKKAAIYTISFFILILFFPNIRHQEGEIRVIGKIENSHENNKLDGCIKKIVEAGYDFIIGKKNCKILLVKQGEKATIENEYLVVAEPGSKIKYNDMLITISEEPLGYINNIEDARLIKVSNDNTFMGYAKINNVSFIATGSPAKISWGKHIK